MELYAGLDLHSRNTYIGIMDKAFNRVFKKRVPNHLEHILQTLAPFRNQIKGFVVESTFNWYWLVDGLMDAEYSSAHLANPSAIKQYEGLKYSDDQHDAFFLAQLLILGNITSTKNKKTRKVDMSNQLTEVLRELKQIQWKRLAGKNVPQWVFAGPRDNVLCCDTLRKVKNHCLEAAGLLHIRIHDLRHTYATIRLLKGHNIGDVSYQLEHSDISTTYNIYTHWIPGKFKSEIDELYLHPNAPKKGSVAIN